MQQIKVSQITEATWQIIWVLVIPKLTTWIRIEKTIKYWRDFRLFRHKSANALFMGQPEKNTIYKS